MDDQITIITQFNINRGLIKMLRIIDYMLQPLSYFIQREAPCTRQTFETRSKLFDTEFSPMH